MIQVTTRNIYGKHHRWPEYFCDCGSQFFRPTKEIPNEMRCPGCEQDHSVEPIRPPPQLSAIPSKKRRKKRKK